MNLHHASHRRRGAALAVVLVCLLVMTVVGAAVAQSLLAGRREARREQDRLQTLWLAESGLARARARVDADPAYSGETWRISADELDDRRGADVEIVVEAAGAQREAGDADAEFDTRRISVTARFGRGPQQIAEHLERRVIVRSDADRSKEDAS